MSTSRKIDRICMGIIAAVLVITILFMNGSRLGLTAAQASMGYETRLFDTGTVHKVDIVMADWDTFIENCESEEYSACTVVIDGESYKNVALRAKGNTSLSNVRSLGSQRYSFKIEFDHYESGKTYYGLDKLCLNNLIQDNTMMKDYLAYQMMKDFGVDTPLCSFVYITVNGEDWGLYLAVEGIEDSFLARNYGSDTGEMYKPDSMSFGGGRGNGKDFNMDDFTNSQEEEESESSSLSDLIGKLFGNSDDNADSGESNSQEDSTGSATQAAAAPDFGGEMPDFSGNAPDFGGEMPDFDGGFDPSSFDGMPRGDGSEAAAGSTDASAAAAEGATGAAASEDGSSENGKSRGFGGFGGFGMGSDDVKLKYIDDDPDSYSNIFDNAKTDVSNGDKARLIASLKNLSEYTDLEDTLDMEEVLRYFVVHNFVVNGDSYTGSMIHNYYLHEKDGKLGMIPWDYNLAYGTFQASDASSSINNSIDNPVSGGDLDDRPMVGWIFSDEAYTERYHELFADFIERWFSNGELAAMIEKTADLIRPYVEKDPTKFCTTEEFETGVDTISKFVTLRAEAVSRQLEGDDTQVDAGDLTLSDMGSMGNGGGPGKGEGGFSGFDLSSLIKVVDAEGNEVSFSDLVGDVSNLASLELSDGTTLDVADADFRTLIKSLTQVDLSTVVSATDKDGKVTDLSDYTLSLNMPSRGEGRGGFGGPSFGGNAGGDAAGSGSTGGSAQDGHPAEDTSAAGDSRDAGGNDSNGEASAPGQGGGFPAGGSGMPGGGSGFPGGQSPFENAQSAPSGQTIWTLVGASALVLAAGILIAMKKKNTKSL